MPSATGKIRYAVVAGGWISQGAFMPGVGQTSRGIDVEASYRRAIGPGDLSLRALGTYTFENVTDNGIDPVTDDNAGTYALPDLQYRFSVGYDMDSGIGMSLVGRGHTGGKYDNDWIECQTNCPIFDNASDRAIYRTINDNNVPGTLYFDTNFNYDFEMQGVQAQLLFAVKNVFDREIQEPVGKDDVVVDDHEPIHLG